MALVSVSLRKALKSRLRDLCLRKQAVFFIKGICLVVHCQLKLFIGICV